MVTVSGSAQRPASEYKRRLSARHRRRRADGATIAAVALAAVSLLGAKRTAQAHDETVSSSEVTFSDNQLTWRVDVGVLGLSKAGKLPRPDPSFEPRLLAPAKDGVAAYLISGLRLALNDQPVSPQIGRLDPRWETAPGSREPTVQRVSLELTYRSARPIEKIRAHVAFFSDLTSQHRAVVTVKTPQGFRQFVRLGVADLEFTPQLPSATALSTLREFILWGAEHIFIGYDHIAFLIGLLLVAVSFRELFRIVTSFTLAHSLTLLLAATDVLRIPSRFTEIAIAASIVYVAAENLWIKSTKHRWWLTFIFGLVHGLGFATVLRERLLELSGSLIMPVLSFNVGVELGQMVIVAVVFPMLLRLRRGADEASSAHRQLRLVRYGSIAILGLGFWWLVQRMSE